jgi:hypothetical protein
MRFVCGTGGSIGELHDLRPCPRGIGITDFQPLAVDLLKLLDAGDARARRRRRQIPGIARLEMGRVELLSRTMPFCRVMATA